MSVANTNGSGPRPATSLQSRIVGVAMVTAVSVLLAACLVFIIEQWRAERESLERHQVHLAETLELRLGPLMEADDHQTPAWVLASLRAVPTITEAVLTDASGRTYARYARVRSARGAPDEPTARPGLEPMVDTSTPVRVGDRTVGRLVIHAQPTTLKVILPRYLSVSGALFLAATGLALFLGRWLARRVMEPVHRLSTAMRGVAQSGDFSQTVEKTGEDELGRLTDTFNGLLGQLNVNDQALRRTMGDLVKARDAAETANVLKSQFLANMSHEIRTPLNGVLAMAQVMAMDEISPRQRERLAVIRQSGEALLSILNDILDVSKIEAGKLELESVEFDVEELARSVHAAFAEMARGKKLAFTLEFAPEARGVRRGDAARTRQILNNLVSNAIKFTPGGSVRLTVEGHGHDGCDGVLVSVIDTGLGVSPEKLPLLFQKFTQLDNSTTRKFGGTGLGLAICHELAQLIGGSVWAESEEGVGSTFHASLPLPRIDAPCDVEPPRSRPDVVPADQGRRLRVLAAEDNVTNQLVLKTILQIFGAELTLVGDGQRAVEAWRAGEFDVVLMDIQMPVMDGVAAARAIRAEEAGSSRPRTPVVALSANAMTHQVKEYLAAGMDAHVAKPIELAKLHQALETALAMSEAAREAA